mmetsp:Transcript_15924/g.24245  ORF Transcript_15924/g.24245 Transcript_15924/m.24245 type:complete len:120 (+) Transcript_15924:363-722(+)
MPLYSVMTETATRIFSHQKSLPRSHFASLKKKPGLMNPRDTNENDHRLLSQEWKQAACLCSVIFIFPTSNFTPQFIEIFKRFGIVLLQLTTRKGKEFVAMAQTNVVIRLGVIQACVIML